MLAAARRRAARGAGARLKRAAGAALVLCMVSAATVTAPDCRAAVPSIGYFEAIKNDPAPAGGGTYYLRHNIKTERNVYNTTNYWRGDFYQVNARARVLHIGSDHMLMEMEESGETISVDISKHGRRGMPVVAKNMLSPAPVPLEKFNADMQANIKAGEVKLGMTREQVIITRGWPPAHKTSSLAANKWKYWSSRFVTVTYEFEKDILVKGRDAD
jgi:hypothetical protein